MANLVSSENTGKVSRKVNHNIDILKYVMCIMIVMIHVGYSFQLPILRVAVPVFFMISSYLFFHKTKGLDTSGQRTSYKKFLIRATELYFFWFIVLLPLTVVIRHWLDLPALVLLRKILIGIFLQSTFPASWYISAYIIGITTAFLLRRHNWMLIVIGLICYSYCCLTTNYRSLPFSQEIIFNEIDWFTSFPAGLLYIGFGKLIAEYGLRSLALGITGIFIGGAGLIFESHILLADVDRAYNDCYFSLMILAPAIFLTVIALPDKIHRSTSMIRNMSTIYYCSHISLMKIVENAVSGLSSWQMLITLIILCTLLSIFLVKLSKAKYFHWVKYSY